MESKVISTAISKNMENFKYALKPVSLQTSNVDNKMEKFDLHPQSLVKNIKENIVADDEPKTCNIKLNVNDNIKEVNYVKIDQNGNENVLEEMEKRTEIQNFFHGKSVFITGATGKCCFLNHNL